MKTRKVLENAAKELEILSFFISDYILRNPVIDGGESEIGGATLLMREAIKRIEDCANGNCEKHTGE